LKLKRPGFLLGRIVGLSQWEGNICLFILGWGRGSGDFLKTLCFFFVWAGIFGLDCPTCARKILNALIIVQAEQLKY